MVSRDSKDDYFASSLYIDKVAAWKKMRFISSVRSDLLYFLFETGSSSVHEKENSAEIYDLGTLQSSHLMGSSYLTFAPSGWNKVIILVLGEGEPPSPPGNASLLE